MKNLFLLPLVESKMLNKFASFFAFDLPKWADIKNLLFIHEASLPVKCAEIVFRVEQMSFMDFLLLSARVMRDRRNEVEG